MRLLLDPQLVNGPFGDPCLYVDLRDEARALMFDAGDVAALPPRKMLRLKHVFVSHAHMDHFAGFDTLLRVLLGRKERLEFFGGPGFIEQVEHKLRAYTWNVVHRYAVPIELEVHELGTEGSRRQALFSSRSGFERAPMDGGSAHGDVLHEDALVRVRARFVDHGTPCLAFVVEEKARVKVAKDRLAALGVTTGPWLRQLKQAVLCDAPDATPVAVRWRDRAGDHMVMRTVGELRPVVLDVVPGQRIGYATDLRYTPENVEVLAALMAGVDRLYIESVFLEADRDHAERKNHLTAHQAGLIARRAGVHDVVPFHFSQRYAGRAGLLTAELSAAWGGAQAPALATM